MAEFDEYLQKCKYVNAPLKWAREQWNSYIKFLSKRIDGYRYYQSKVRFQVGSEQEIGTNQSVILGVDTDSVFSDAPAFSDSSDQHSSLSAATNATSPDDFFTTHQKNVAEVKNVRGLLTTVSVSDFIKNETNRTGLCELIANYYYDPGVGGINSNPYSEVDPEGEKVIDVKEKYSDWVVPVIEWFYDEQKIVDGEPVMSVKNDIKMFCPDFLVQTRAVQRKWYETKSISGHTMLTPKQDMISTSPILYRISPPFRNPQGGTNHSFIWRQYVTSAWDKTGITAKVYMFDTPNSRWLPYVPLASFVESVPPSGVITIENSMNKVGHASAKGPIFYAYRTTQAVIDFFADFGVHLYTDISDIYSQPDGDREQDNEINPDNPDEPLPAFPDNTTDVIPIERAYITASSFGNSNVYTPTTTKSFLNWVCDSSVSIENWKRLFANPADVITGILLYNLDIVQHDSALTRLNSETNILGVTTPIANYSIIDGYNNIIDGGSINLQAYYGNYSDFTNMTYQLFAPFVGFVSLRACDVVNKTLSLKYAVDFATGAAVAFVTSDNKLVYSAPCSVCGKIPLSISDRNQQILNNTFSALNSIGGIVGGIASGNVGGAVSAALGGKYQFQTNYAARGSMTSVNMFSLFPAFIERTRYDLFLPSGEKTYVGAAYQTAAGAPTTDFTTVINAADVGGYVECEFVQISSATATEEEKAQIIALLKSGIYI